MKKYFIADWLTAAKLLPAVALFIFVDKMPIWCAFGCFAVGELLDALDGIAAKAWPHPEWTDELWFRKHIKQVESGLDMLLGIAALVFMIVRVSATLGFAMLVAAVLVGASGEILLYGKILGSAKDYKDYALFARKPLLARKIVGLRLLLYLAMVGVVAMVLLWSSEFALFVKAVTTCVAIVVAGLLIIKKASDGRLEDVQLLHK